MYKGQNTGFIAYPFGFKLHSKPFPIDKIFPLKKLPFEDFEIPVPVDTDYMLTLAYGKNYMTPLPEGQRSYIIPYKISLGDENKNEG